MKVLFVAGSARSGSTLLGSLLGQIEGFFDLGEARMVWDRGILDDRSCGCGQTFSQCAVWPAVIEEAFGPEGPLNPLDLASTGHRLTRNRNLPTMLIRRVRERALEAMPEYLEHVASLYKAIQTVTGAKVLVDTSKAPMYGLVLRTLGLDVRVAHLVRDPRGVALSHFRPKRHVDIDGFIRGTSIVNASVVWSLVNHSTEMLLGDEQYRRIGYNRLIENPARVLRDLVVFAGEPSSSLPEFLGSTIDIRPTHNVFGNPGRFNTGDVSLRLDERWRGGLTSRQRRTVELLTWGLRRRYTGLL